MPWRQSLGICLALQIKSIFSRIRRAGVGGTPNEAGKDYDKSAYAELTIPILGGPWSKPGARLLEFVASERYDDYSSFGAAWKPKLSIRWKPFGDLTFRASYSEGFRAPSLAELVQSNLTSFQSIIDPTPPAGTASNYEVRQTSPGNPALKPGNAYAYYAAFV